MFTSIRWQQRFQNFEKAFQRLEEGIERINETPDDQLLMAGLVQTYEFTMELGWKTTKDYLEELGYELVGPKIVMKQAVEAKIVRSGRMWMEAIDHRNETSHTYNRKIAEKVIKKIKSDYFQMLKELYEFFTAKFNE